MIPFRTNSVPNRDFIITWTPNHTISTRRSYNKCKIKNKACNFLQFRQITVFFAKLLVFAKLPVFRQTSIRTFRKNWNLGCSFVILSEARISFFFIIIFLSQFFCFERSGYISAHLLFFHSPFYFAYLCFVYQAQQELGRKEGQGRGHIRLQVQSMIRICSSLASNN